MIHLETSFLIRGLARDSLEDQQLRAWLRDAMPLGISAVSWAEFLCGPVRPSEVELAMVIVQEPVPFAAADSTLTARLFELAGRRRRSLAHCMIAATAIRAGAALATANPSDFGSFVPAGLKLLAPKPRRH